SPPRNRAKAPKANKRQLSKPAPSAAFIAPVPGRGSFCAPGATISNRYDEKPDGTPMSEKYDLVVIGGGSGGVRAARMSAGFGAKVAIVEEYRYGGTCVIRGCVPKKLFVYASRYNELLDV